MKILSDGQEIPDEVYRKVVENLNIIASHSGYISEVADSLCIFFLSVAPLVYWKKWVNGEKHEAIYES